MLEWLIYQVPWWLWAGLALLLYAVGLYVAAAFFGWPRVRPFALPVLAVIGALSMVGRSRQQGWEDKVKADLRAADKHIERARRTREKADAAIAEQQRKGRLRDDDGFRRD